MPIGPGVVFEISEPTFIYQDERFSVIELDDRGESDIFFPDVAFDGVPLATVTDVVDALQRHGDFTIAVVGTRVVSGYEATEVDFTFHALDFGRNHVLEAAAVAGTGWKAPPAGTLWVMETPDGLAVITAEWYAPAAEEDARALAEEVLDSVVIGG